MINNFEIIGARIGDSEIRRGHTQGTYYFYKKKKSKPLVTICVALINSLIFLFGKVNANIICLSASRVIDSMDWRVLITYCWFHLNYLHILETMIPFVIYGYLLESEHGSGYFSLLLIIFMFMISFIYVGIEYFAFYVLSYKAAIQLCFTGFSGRV